ncbi:beta strand repeat-containing protein [Erwinia rhapontici]|uniref:beta strand repeat-containing protein n=1 Tax=Erwinia rhapontici TaxID=55212 RepID=UPI001BB35266|nr:Ig-like domain-containing protein [Erwinia rhapontici]
MLTYADGSTSAFDVSMDPAALSAISSLPSINDVTQVVISSASFSVLQDINIVDVKQIGPTVSAVSSSTADGAYKAGSTVLVSVDFSTAVTVNTTGGTPTLLLETGATDRQATYVSGSGTSTLVFSYVVQSGDQSADLNYVSSSSLVLNGATISDSSSGKNASVTLPDAGALTSLGGAKNIVIDTQLPTATVSLSDTALTIGETATVTITFSEKVSDFSNADLTVSGGTLSAVSSADGGTTWTGTFTPTNGTTTSGNQITLNMTGVQDAAGNSGSGTVSSASYAVDTVRPTASIVVADSTLIAGETSLVTITFSEAVTGLTNTDLSIANGTLSTVSSSDGGLTWTATFTPNTTVQDTTNIITLDNTGVADQAGNAGTGTTDSNNYSIDTQRPTASIVMADNALRIGETSLVTITFSEAVSGFTNQDLNIVNGTLTAVSSADGGITWTATFTPTSNVTDATNLISLDNTGVVDQAGNAGTGTTTSNNYSIDTQRPTATIVLADNALRIGETSLVTITFSEAVTGFTNADLIVANGTLSAVSSADGGITWTATFTPAAGITDNTNLITLDNTGISDLSGNAGSGTSDSNNYAIDTQRPTATIVMADSALSTGETSLVTITFSEAVTGFTNADLTIPNGTLTSVVSSDGGITWTATYTPNINVQDTTNLIVLTNTGVSDLAGNAGSGTTSSGNFTIDTRQPTATVVVADSALRIGESSLVTITFSEAVTGFTNADLSVANGTLSAVSSSDGGITWTATFTPSGNIADVTNVITLDNSGVQNAAGNAGSGTTSSNNYAIDTQRPTATVVLSDTVLSIGETSLVTITFSEAVTGFTNADLIVANGTLSAASSADGGITWTATFTPAAGITDNTNLITLDNTGISDLSGNAGSGTSDSNNYAIDTQRPTATIVMADSALSTGETSLVTITFSEAVTDFDNSDLSVSNGTLSAVSSSDGGITWTATFTPNQNIQDATNLIRLNNSGVLDFAGNVGVGTTESLNYSINTVRPTATIVMADHSLLVGETSLVTITFSEAVSGFNNGDLTVNNGTLSSVSSSDGGITWTATFTPGSNVTDSSNIITLDNSGVFNAAGNAGVGTTDSNNYAIDTQRPTATIVVGNPNIGIGGTSQVTFTFNEAVSGFNLSDVSIANGTLSNLTSADGGSPGPQH